MTEPEKQAPTCLTYTMRQPQPQGMTSYLEPLADWLLLLPGCPFEVRVWESGRWTICVGREQVAHGREDDAGEGRAQAAALAAGDKLGTWGALLTVAAVLSVPEAPQVAPAMQEQPKPIIQAKPFDGKRR